MSSMSRMGFSSIAHSHYAAQPSLNPLSDPSWFSDGRKTKPRKTSCFCAQLRLTLCNPMDCSPSGSSVHGNHQARILEWVATSYSRGCSRPRERTHISCVGRWTQTLAPPGKLLSAFKHVKWGLWKGDTKGSCTIALYCKQIRSGQEDQHRTRGEGKRTDWNTQFRKMK